MKLHRESKDKGWGANCGAGDEDFLVTTSLLKLRSSANQH